MRSKKSKERIDALRKENIEKYVVGYRDEALKGGQPGITRRVKVRVLSYNGETGTAKELAERHGLTITAVYNRIYGGTPLDQPVRKSRVYDYNGKKMTAMEIATEVCHESGDNPLTLKTVMTRIYRGTKDLAGAFDVGNVYTFVDFDGETRKATTTELCKYYAKFHGVPFTKRLLNKVRSRLGRCCSTDSLFNVKDLFSDEVFWHKRGTKIDKMTPSVV